MPNVLVNDGSVQVSSRDITVGSETYSTDDFSFNIPTGQTIERTDSRNVPDGVVHIRGRTTGQATFQLATQAQALPDWGAQFTVTEGICTITSVGRTETKAGETKVPITFAINITTDIVIDAD